MNDHTPSDAVIEAVLGARAGTGAPAGLRHEIVAAALGDATARGGRGGSAGRARRVRTLRLLAIAAVLGTVGGGALLVGSLRLDDTETPAPSAPEGPGAQKPCTAMGDDAYVTGPDDQFVPAATGPRKAGPIVYARAVPGGLRLTQAEDGATIGDRIVMGIVGLAVAPDGGQIAVSTAGINGWACADPLLVSVADGTFRRPFVVGRLESVSRPTWSSDGATLYAFHQTLATGPLAPPEDPGSVWAWDRRADIRRDLGVPCEGCLVVALYPDPASDRMVATYVAGPCDNVPAPGSCPWGAAVLDKAGSWQVAVPAEPLGPDLGPPWSEPLGVSPDGRLVVRLNDAIALLGLDGSGWSEPVGRPCCYGLEGALLAPDGSTVVGTVGREDGLGTQLAVFDVESMAWRVEATITAHLLYPAASAWSPNSDRIAIGQGAVARIVPIDGTDVEDVPLPDSAGEALAWLPARP